MLLGILLTVHILVCIALIGVVLLQRSEGGGLVSSSSGFMTARGQSDLLTRTTWILGTLFIVLSLGLTLLAGAGGQGRSVTERFEVESVDPEKLNQRQQPVPAAPDAPAPAEAPLPTLRNPLEAPAAPGSAPLAPAPAQPAQ